MSAKIVNLDDKLPKVKPEVRRTPSSTPPRPPAAATRSRLPKHEPTMNELIIEDAVKRLENKAKRAVRNKGVTNYNEANLTRAVAGRLDIAKYGRNPRREVEAMQKTLALLTWELGIVLEDMESFGETTTNTESSK